MKRVITAAVAIPIVVLVTLYASNSVFAGLVGLITAGAAQEFLSLAARKGIEHPGKWFLLPAGVVGYSFVGGFSAVVAALSVASISLMTVRIFRRSIDTAFASVSVGLASVIYAPLMLGFLILVPRTSILLLFAIIWLGDAAAYYGGRAIGRHALAAHVSPKKTIEGAIAGLIGSLAAGVVGGSWILGEPWSKAAGVSVATAVAGQLGDLAESVLKRSAGVKDSSSILPGHGGILDRLDSLLFATPVFYWLFRT
jgi:phosphatidate cytidylyltransferase